MNQLSTPQVTFNTMSVEAQLALRAILPESADALTQDIVQKLLSVQWVQECVAAKDEMPWLVK